MTGPRTLWPEPDEQSLNEPRWGDEREDYVPESYEQDDWMPEHDYRD